MMLRSEKLRKLAAGMQGQIDRDMNPAVSNQNLTPRRAAMAENIMSRARFAQKVQGTLLNLADAFEADSVPPALSYICNKKEVEFLLSQWRFNEDKMLTKIRIFNQDDLDRVREALKPFIPSESASCSKEQKIKTLERGLLGAPIPGFFPTPKPVIEKLIEFADIREGMKILEPSAGKGDITDEISSRFNGMTQIHACEIHYSLREILEVKGVNLVGSDILTTEFDGPYDRIVMNPPFEKGQDIEHILFCFDLLGEGGRLVSVISPGPFFRQNRKEKQFRDWFEERGGEVYDLEPGSFKGKESFRQTGVAAKVVVLDK